MTDRNTDVLVVGAGPTGLALALAAHDHGARVRVVERRESGFRPSRALIMHPRTLEVLRPSGVTDDLLRHGDASPVVNLHLGQRSVRVALADLSLPDTHFAHLLLVRQADVESVLTRALHDRGVDVEMSTELLAVRGASDQPCALVHTGAQEQRVGCRFLVGCDGPSSTVRHGLGIGWRGGPYRQEVVLADVELDGDLAGEAHVVAAKRGLLFAFALGEKASWRLLATRPSIGGMGGVGAFGKPGEPVPKDHLQRLIDDTHLGARITTVAWSARVPLQHRLADRFRHGSVFLAGDAAHAGSPAAAQGMNTGIQDAMNLGWKLGLAARSAAEASTALLDSYQTERRPVARQVLALTHSVFWAEAGTDPVAMLVRGVLAPLFAPVVPTLLARRRLVAEGLRLLSGLRWQYRHSPLNIEGSPPANGSSRAGDRMPDECVWLSGRSTRLHDVLARPGVHLLLHADAAEPSGLVGCRWLHVHRISNWPGRGVTIVRPDGYVGFRSGGADPAEIMDWLCRAGVIS